MQTNLKKQEDFSETLNSDFEAFLEKYKKHIKKFKKMEERVNKCIKRPVPQEDPTRRTKARRTDAEEDEDTYATDADVQELKGRLNAVELRLDHMNPTFDSFELEERVKTLETKIGGEVFVMHDQRFGSLYELELWVEEAEVPSCGLFWDLFSVLVIMNQEMAQTGKARVLVVMNQEMAQTGKARVDSTYSSTRIKST
jgi:hypothetical protein